MKAVFMDKEVPAILISESEGSSSFSADEFELDLNFTFCFTFNNKRELNQFKIKMFDIFETHINDLPPLSVSTKVFHIEENICAVRISILRFLEIGGCDAPLPTVQVVISRFQKFSELLKNNENYDEIRSVIIKGLCDVMNSDTPQRLYSYGRPILEKITTKFKGIVQHIIEILQTANFFTDEDYLFLITEGL